MAGPNYICPKCGFRLRPSDLRREGKPYFECASCNQKLCVSVAYRRFLMFTELAISILLPFFLGIRDVVEYFAIAILALLPVAFLFAFLIRSIYPPRFQPYEAADMSLRQITKGGP